jgi:hypothetical protein
MITIRKMMVTPCIGLCPIVVRGSTLLVTVGGKEACVDEEACVDKGEENKSKKELRPLKYTMIATRLATMLSTSAIVSNVLRISFLSVVNIGMKLLGFLQLFW